MPPPLDPPVALAVWRCFSTVSVPLTRGRRLREGQFHAHRLTGTPLTAELDLVHFSRTGDVTRPSAAIGCQRKLDGAGGSIPEIVDFPIGRDCASITKVDCWRLHGRRNGRHGGGKIPSILFLTIELTNNLQRMVQIELEIYRAPIPPPDILDSFMFKDAVFHDFSLRYEIRLLVSFTSMHVPACFKLFWHKCCFRMLMCSLYHWSGFPGNPVVNLAFLVRVPQEIVLNYQGRDLRRWIVIRFP